jgi:hypothetical protein
VPAFSANYTLVPVQPSEAFPKKISTNRPYLRVTLFNGTRDFSCYAIAGSRGQLAYFFDIEVEIAGVLKYQLPTGFTQAMDASRVGLLGQNGFFDRFNVSFLLRRTQVHSRNLRSSACIVSLC